MAHTVNSRKEKSERNGELIIRNRIDYDSSRHDIEIIKSLYKLDNAR